MTTNNYKLTEVINISNQTVQCDCNKHNPEDFECACEDCMQEQVERLDEMLIAKAVSDTEHRIIKLLEKHSIEANEGGWTYCNGCKWDGNRGVGFDQHLVELINRANK